MLCDPPASSGGQERHLLLPEQNACFPRDCEEALPLASRPVERLPDSLSTGTPLTAAESRSASVQQHLGSVATGCPMPVLESVSVSL